MDLPTYTSIWRIEKRLYKLYDFRLPMPLPIGQVTVFAAIAVPYVVLLTVLGLPFNHTLIWLYILPPGLATWLVTRPVLESKRLPELIKSQLRYVSEPRVLCRMAPLSEREVVFVSGRVWRPRAGRRDADVLAESEAELDAELEAFELDDEAVLAAAPARTAKKAEEQRPAGLRRGPLPPGRSGHREQSQPDPQPVSVAQQVRAEDRAAGRQRARPVAAAATAGPPRPATGSAPLTSGPSRPAAARAPWPHGSGYHAPRPPAQPSDRLAAPAPPPRADVGAAHPTAQVSPARAVPRAELRLAATGRPAQASQPASPPPAAPAGETPGDLPGRAGTAGMDGALHTGAWPAHTDGAGPEYVGHHARQDQADGPGADAPASIQPEPTAQPASQPRPVVTVVGADRAKTLAPSVERALAGPSARRGDLRPARVSVVPGGHRPGKPDLLQRDRSRAQLPLELRPRIVVLGCTVGAGQTMTTLLIGEVLAGLRSDQVAVMDLNPGFGSLARRAEGRPAVSQSALTGRSRLVVIGQRAPAVTPAAPPRPREPATDAITFEAATDRYDIVLADPATVTVPRLLAVADQLVLVAPASGAAPGAIAMTFEWLEAHGQSALAAGSVMVLNGVSARSAGSVEQAERVCAARCRATVRIPWDDQLQHQVTKRPLAGTPASQLRQHWTGVLNPATAAAYTALAGILVASLAGPSPGQERGTGRDAEPAQAGQVGQ